MAATATSLDPRTTARRWAAWVAVAVPAVLYYLTVYPGPGGRVSIGDAVKFQFVGRTLSVPHEPGYPQYVLLTYLWSYVPIPVNLATRINMFSALCALVAGGLVFATARRLSGSVVASVLAVWFLLLSADVWLLASQAEVYTLNLAWVAAVLYTGTRWRQEANRKWLVAMMVCYALSFGNHLLMITLLPALLVLVLAVDASVFVAPRMLLAGIAAVAMSLAQYTLLWWRSYNIHYNMLPRFPREASFIDILRWSSGAHFTEQHFLADGLGPWFGRFVETWGYGIGVLTPALVLLALFGLGVLWRRDRPAAAFLLTTAMLVTGFAAAYRIRSWPYYCFPAWLAIVLLASVGMQHVYARGRVVRGLVMTVLVLSLAATAVGNLRELRALDDTYDADLAVAAAPDNAIIVLALGTRTNTNLRHYYAAVFGFDRVREMTFIGARDLLADSSRLLGFQPIYVQSPSVADWLRQRGIERVFGPNALDPDSARFVQMPTAPVEAVTYARPRPNRVSISIRDQVEQVAVRPSVYLTVIERDGVRAKGTLRWTPDAEGEWIEELRHGIVKVRAGEPAIVLGLQLSRRQRALVVDALAEFGIELPPIDDQRADVLVAFQVDHGLSTPIVTVLGEGLVVPIPLPATQ